jgi:hypothetical protein
LIADGGALFFLGWEGASCFVSGTPGSSVGVPTWTGEGLAFLLALALLALAMGLVGSLAAWSLGSCSKTVGSSSRIVREAKRASVLTTGRRVRLALALGGVPLFFLIELPRGEVIVVLEVWARVPGMFADCDEDINLETVCCFLEKLCGPLV